MIKPRCGSSDELRCFYCNRSLSDIEYLVGGGKAFCIECGKNYECLQPCQNELDLYYDARKSNDPSVFKGYDPDAKIYYKKRG